MLFLWKFINNSKNHIHAFWLRQICDEVAEEILSVFLKNFKKMQQACESLLRSFSIFAYYAVKDVIINIVI